MFRSLFWPSFSSIKIKLQFYYPFLFIFACYFLRFNYSYNFFSSDFFDIRTLMWTTLYGPKCQDRRSSLWLYIISLMWIYHGNINTWNANDDIQTYTNGKKGVNNVDKWMRACKGLIEQLAKILWNSWPSPLMKYF